MTALDADWRSDLDAVLIALQRAGICDTSLTTSSDRGEKRETDEEDVGGKDKK